MEENEIQNSVGAGTPIPNATAVLVLGIISIPACWCYGLVGLILAIIALVLASKAMQAYNANPEAYTPGSFKNLKAGRICAFIGLGLSILYMIIVIIGIATMGMESLQSSPWENF